MESLQKFTSAPDMNELHRVAASFEQKIFSTATNQVRASNGHQSGASKRRFHSTQNCAVPAFPFPLPPLVDLSFPQCAPFPRTSGRISQKMLDIKSGASKGHAAGCKADELSASQPSAPLTLPRCLPLAPPSASLQPQDDYLWRISQEMLDIKSKGRMLQAARRISLFPPRPQYHSPSRP
ncbi:unnamed protein product [Closterium sp. Naga37s-1]|nr:unnamed protein product [Closterium sp. Naga37s-1]